MKRANKILCLCEDAMLVIGILSAAIVLFINVVLRNIASSSLIWAEEYAKFSIIWVTFGGCGAAVREKAHMNISALYDVVGKNAQKVLDIFIALAGFAFSVFMIIYGIQLTIKTITTAQVSPTMMLPMWIIYVSVPIGAALMALRFAAECIRICRWKSEKEGN